MVILIGGSSHVGKTMLAKMLLEKYHLPTLSLDHLKMGLIRAGLTHLTPEDDDEMREFLFPVAAEMIKTVIENRQDLIVEGCYIPGDWAKFFSEEYLKEIRPCFVVMGEGYLREHFDLVRDCASVVEQRLCDDPDPERLIACSAFFKEEAEQNGTPVLEIMEEYEPAAVFARLEKILGLEGA